MAAPEKKQDSEVIARKAKGYIAALIFSFIIAVVFMVVFGAIIISVAVTSGGNIPMYAFGAVILVGGIALCISSGIRIRKIKQIPEVIISREGDTLTFHMNKEVSFSCKLDEVKNLSYYQMYGRGQTQPWGTLVVFLAWREMKFMYVKDVVAAHNRLFALTLAKQKEEKAEETGENNG